MLWSTKAENMKVAAVGNLALSLCIGFHYFLRVWSPAMEGHPPKTSQLSYTLYTGERVYFYFKFIFITVRAIVLTPCFISNHIVHRSRLLIVATTTRKTTPTPVKNGQKNGRRCSGSPNAPCASSTARARKVSTPSTPLVTVNTLCKRRRSVTSRPAPER